MPLFRVCSTRYRVLLDEKGSDARCNVAENRSSHVARNGSDARGDAFRSRNESSLTDPKIEPRKEQWEAEVAIKLGDDQL
jgi:hypothetical protein